MSKETIANKKSKEAIVKEIIELVGGEANINSVSHCFTRLRIKLKDRQKVDEESLKKIPEVIGLYDRGGEFQIIMGNTVSEYYAEAQKFLGNKLAGAVDEKIDEDIANKQKKMSLFDKISDVVSGIFIPLIGVLAACGTLQGLLSLLTFLNIVSRDSGTFLVIDAIAQSIFYFLPFYLAYTSATKFGGKPFISMTIAAVMMYPTVMEKVGGSVEFLGIPLLLMNYSKTVLPIIAASWLASVVERQARKLIPDIVKMIFVPIVVLVIVVPITLLVVGPVLTKAMAIVTETVFFLYKASPVITGTIVGGVWQLLVFLGISKAFIPIFTSDFATYGYSSFGAITFFVAVMGQTGAVLAIALKTKNKDIKAVGFGATISGLFGITEPALFGLNFPAKKPFIIGSISAAIGGLIASLLNGKLYSLATGILGIPGLINPESGLDMGFYGTIIASVVTFVISLAVTYKFGWDEQNDKKMKV